ncbi:anther-specific proline-rich protein APG [Ricinus communis]|uniref:anther-specific proline-rich protein APG n=1 Tax=Ricinus communis TaxID=3988 RepID=UPI00077296B8|nr:anther-specific proline-rich protein APG [Ricinus communis]|eukprot:XP_015571232.1 anther-specific proline-rich protein APG [Ricinus communis]
MEEGGLVVTFHMLRNGYASPSSSSPPTPPSPLPISVGPGNQKYYFTPSPSPSPSPPFSQPPSSHTSADQNLPLLSEDLVPQVPSAFSLDRPHHNELDSKSSCLQDLLEWFIQKCCNCCSKSL